MCERVRKSTLPALEDPIVKQVAFGGILPPEPDHTKLLPLVRARLRTNWWQLC